MKKLVFATLALVLALVMLVWFGVQEALASAHGGPGFSMARFLNLFMLLTFAYAMVNYYDSSIPGLGFSIKSFIDGGTTNLVALIGADGSSTMLNEIHAASSLLLGGIDLTKTKHKRWYRRASPEGHAAA